MEVLGVFFFLGTSSTLTQESEGAGERVVVKKKTHQEDGMWRSWAFFFFLGGPYTSNPNRLWLTGSPAHWLTGSPAQDKLQPNQARDLYLERLWSVTSKMCSVGEGFGLLLPKGILFGRAFF